MEPDLNRGPNPLEASGPGFLYYKEAVPISEGKKLEFHSGATANLLFHTLNIYGFLGSLSTSDYEKINEVIGDVPDKAIQTELLKFKEENHDNIISDFIILDPHTPEELINSFGESADSSIQLFAQALAKSWEKYKSYWETRTAKLYPILQANVEIIPWAEYAQKMELVTGATFDLDMNIIAVEALMRSASYVEPNIAIGSIGQGNDAGFVHEGLHLLLKKDWAKEERTKNLVPRSWHDDFWKSNWDVKFEQAVVVSLDQLIRNRPQSIEGYFKGCRVEGLEKFFFGPIKDWYEAKLTGQTEEKLSDIIYKILSSHKKELIDDLSWQDDSRTN
ncbi:MAG: hypothetical protein WCV68_01660 [Candidatus Paceibacterota bacterium]